MAIINKQIPFHSYKNSFKSATAMVCVLIYMPDKWRNKDHIS